MASRASSPSSKGSRPTTIRSSATPRFGSSSRIHPHLSEVSQSIRLSANRSNNKRTTLESVDELSRELDICMGSLSFQPRAAHLAKWARVPMPSTGNLDEEVRTWAEKLFFGVWQMPRPSVMISVTGSAKDTDLPPHIELAFRRGLKDAVATTSAWVISGGMDKGVMKLVGRTLRELTAESGKHAVCIGFAAWRAVAHHARLLSSTQGGGGIGRIYPYGKLPHDDLDSSKEASLEPNHSHFVLVDDGKEDNGKEPWGAEIGVRVAVEEVFCPDNADTQENIGVPKVLLVLGGGPRTLQNVQHALDNDRPVVVLPESGGAAKLIYDACFNGLNFALRQPEGAILKEKKNEDEQEFLDVLRDVVTLSTTYSGKSEQAVSFFAVADPFETPPLSEVILRALVNDLKDNPADSIRLAVEWKDAAVIRSELDELRDDKDEGITLAFEQCLAMAEPEVVRVLVDFKIDPARIRLNDMVMQVDGSDVGLPSCFHSGNGRLQDEIRKLDKFRHLALKSNSKLSSTTAEMAAWAAPSCQMGFAVLIEHLEWYFSYGSGYLKYRRSARQDAARLEKRALAASGRERAKSNGEKGSIDAMLEVKPNWTDLTLWAVLAGQPQLAKLLWKKVQSPLRIAMTAALICQQQAGLQRGRLAEQLAQQATEYESWVIGMLQQADQLDQPEVAALLEAFPVRAVAGSGGRTLIDQWAESPLELAMGGRTQNGDTVRLSHVLSHRFVTEFFQQAFDGYVRPTPLFCDEEDDEEQNDTTDASYFDNSLKSWMSKEHMEEVNLPVFGRVYFNRDRTDWTNRLQGSRAMCWQTCRRVVDFFRVPKIKFFTHTLIASLAYIVILVTQLCSGLPWNQATWMRRSGTLPEEIGILEWANYVWAACRFVDELKQMYRQGADGYAQTEETGLNGALSYFRSNGNLLDLFNLGSIFGIAALRICVINDVFEETMTCLEGYACVMTEDFVQRILRCWYAIVVITTFARFLDSLKIMQRFGVLYITLLKMTAEVIDWLSLVIFITAGVGVAFTVLMPFETSFANTHDNYFMHPFWRPFWSILGEFDLDGVDDYFDREAIPTAPMTMVLLFVYVFIITVVLVNLLIAQMSATYEDMREQGYHVWLSERILLIKEFKDERDALPAPLNVFELLFLQVPRLLLALSRMACRRVMGCLRLTAVVSKAAAGAPVADVAAAAVGAENKLEEDEHAELASEVNEALGTRHRRGFKLELRGIAIEHANDLSQALCEAYLDSCEMDACVEDSVNLLMKKQDSTSKQLDAIRGKMVRLEENVHSMLQVLVPSVRGPDPHATAQRRTTRVSQDMHEHFAQLNAAHGGGVPVRLAPPLEAIVEANAPSDDRAYSA